MNMIVAHELGYAKLEVEVVCKRYTAITQLSWFTSATMTLLGHLSALCCIAVP